VDARAEYRHPPPCFELDAGPGLVVEVLMVPGLDPGAIRSDAGLGGTVPKPFDAGVVIEGLFPTVSGRPDS